MRTSVAPRSAANDSTAPIAALPSDSSEMSRSYTIASDAAIRSQAYPTWADPASTANT
jgi:hypothetical protein